MPIKTVLEEYPKFSKYIEPLNKEDTSTIKNITKFFKQTKVQPQTNNYGFHRQGLSNHSKKPRHDSPCDLQIPRKMQKSRNGYGAD